MKEKSHSARVLRAARSDPTGSRGRHRLSAKLRARLKKLEKWRIRSSSIKSPKDAREFHGGHAAVSKAFLLHNNWRSKSYNAREALKLCRQSPESDGHTRGTADDRLEAEEEHGEEEKDDEEEHGSDSDSLWRGEFVAVKKSRTGDNKDLERVLGLALRETEFLVGLSHPNVVELKGFVEDVSNDVIWLVFPWAENGDLKHFVESQDWQIPERVSLINDVAEGLEYLHSQESPICHGDLKSANILVNSKHRAVITDFGSARRLTKHDPNEQMEQVQTQPQPFQASFCASSNTITLTGNKYTLRWAAPEVLSEDQMSLCSDIWAFGWIAYEVMTNSTPFEDVPADAMVVERVIKGDLPSITEHARMTLLQALCSLMVMCWNSNPSERPTAEDCRKAVDWMPKIIPNPSCEPDATVSGVHSPELLIQLAWMYKGQGDYVNALGCFTEALQIRTNMGDRKGKATSLLGLAEVHRLRGEYSEAITLYSEVLQIYTEIGYRHGRADALYGLADVHRLRNEYSEAIAHYSEALQIFTDIGNRQGRANALWGLAKVQDEHNEAIALYSKALQMWTDIGDRHGRAFALQGLADVHWLRNEYGEAYVHYSEALQIRTDLGDMRGRAFSLLGLADVHRSRDEDSKAIALYSEVLQICIDIGDRQGRANALCGLAEVHRHRNEYSEAIPFYSEALKIRTDIGDRKGRANALWGLAKVHRLRNEYSEAIPLYSQSLQIYTDIDDKEGRAYALEGLADIHRHYNHPDDATSLYEQAAQMFEQSGNRDAAAAALKEAADARQRPKPVEAA